MASDAGSDELSWYDPELRGIIPLDRVHITRSLRKVLQRETFTVTINQAFAEVMHGCATIGLGGHEARDTDTWISPRITQLYTALHGMGHAHSVEVWQSGQLVGGAYGVALGSAFFGESMFSRTTDASKVALAHLLARLIRQGYTLCDTQYLTPHLAVFGGIEIPRVEYKNLLAAAIAKPAQFASVSSGTGSSTADVGDAAVTALLAGAAEAAG